MNSRRKTWDSVASYYDVVWEVADYSPLLQSIVEGAAIHVGMRVIDVAAGTGVVSLEAARRVGQYGGILCIDYSKLMLERVRNKAKLVGMRNVEFMLADASSLPFADNCFDAVTCCWGFSFFTDPYRVANEMKRVVKPASKFAVVEWEQPSIKFWLDLRKNAHIRDFKESELVGIFRCVGWRDVYTRRDQIPHRKAGLSQDLTDRFQLYMLTMMGLKEEDREWVFKKLSDEYARLPSEEKHWLPVLYVGKK